MDCSAADCLRFRPATGERTLLARSAAATANLRDQVFGLALPADWQLEAAEPPGLACSLFRYQKRCLSWLKWRESLGVGAGGDGGTSSTGSAARAASQDTAVDVAVDAAAAEPDAGSSKAALPTGSPLWQPLVLPSGLWVHHNSMEGCVSLTPVEVPLPEVPGGLLCDEMGLGEHASLPCLPALLPACLHACMHACMPACLPALLSLRDSLPACLPACTAACLPAMPALTACLSAAVHVCMQT